MRSQLVGSLVISMLLGAGGAEAGIEQQGVSIQGVSIQGVSIQGVSIQGVSIQGVSIQGVSIQGVSIQGVSIQGSQLTGWSGSTYVSGEGLEGAYMLANLSNGQTAWLYVWDAKTDTTQSTLTNPTYRSNSDVWLYRIMMYTDAGWIDPCPGDRYGMLMSGGWNANGQWSSSSTNITYACTSGVIAKCARSWGYKPWKAMYDPYGQYHSPSQIRQLHQGCVHAARAAYCANEVSFTEDGNAVDLFDNFGFNTPLDEDARHGMFGMEAYFEPRGAYQLFDQTRNGDWGHVLDGCHAGAHIDQTFKSQPAPGTINGTSYANLRDYLVDGAWTSPQTAHQLGLRHIAVSTATHCTHSPAEVGEPLGRDCNSCTEAVCAESPDCCVSNKFYYGEWSPACVAKAAEVCGDQLWSAPRPFFDDSFEDNDTLSTAKTLLFGYFNGLWASASDRDFYRLLWGGSVRIDYDQAAGNLDLRVWHNGVVTAYSTGTTGTDYVSVPSGAIVEVYATGSAANVYSMSVNGWTGADAIASEACSYGNAGTQLSNASWIKNGFYAGYGLCSNTSAWVRAEQDMQVKVYFNHAAGNLNAAAYNAAGQLVGLSLGTSNVETVTVPMNGYLQVYGVSGASNRFSLAIAYTGGDMDLPASLDTEPRLHNNIAPVGDVDEHPVPYAGTVTVSFEHSLGDVDVIGYDRNGTIVSWSTGVTDVEQLWVPSGGKVRVYGYGGATNAYAISIIR
jgi:hypothetical protein